MGTKSTWIYVGLYLLGLIWSGLYPSDRFTWLLEVIPAVIGLVILGITRTTFPLTPIAYLLILMHAWILYIGGHYTYAEVPFFDVLGNWLGWERNNYDKVGHFAQGFVPALLCREILIRKRVLQRQTWLPFIVICICLSVSAFYEFLEWWVSVLSGSSGDAFLGTQGFVWDTQSDMFLALCGAVLMLVSLSRQHDKQIVYLVQE